MDVAHNPIVAFAMIAILSVLVGIVVALVAVSNIWGYRSGKEDAEEQRRLAVSNGKGE